MTKLVRVSGTAVVNWTAYLPPGSKPNVCADPAVEAVYGPFTTRYLAEKKARRLRGQTFVLGPVEAGDE